MLILKTNMKRNQVQDYCKKLIDNQDVNFKNILLSEDGMAFLKSIYVRGRSDMYHIPDGMLGIWEEVEFEIKRGAV